ncbi:hypothetical protein SVAN01_11489 [Stagonosporopsis vannaccii]|nr:hypothetical protein SVAN01_11489 [Stagonosporopsis vannaccii]
MMSLITTSALNLTIDKGRNRERSEARPAMPFAGMCNSKCVVNFNKRRWLMRTADCIQKNNFDEGKCRKEVDALYECCNAFYKEKGDDARCVTCPKPDLLRIKLKQRADGIS